jgi:predicted nucleic acid-binding protein
MSYFSIIPQTIYERAVLFDTCALEAIMDERDQRYEQAIGCLNELKEIRYPFYITTYTICETHRRLLYKSGLGYPIAKKFLDEIYGGFTNIIRPHEEDEMQAKEFIERFEEEKLSFTDAISMAVMKRKGLKKVFTFDWHFTLIGFEVIPPL